VEEAVDSEEDEEDAPEEAADAWLSEGRMVGISPIGRDTGTFKGSDELGLERTDEFTDKEEGSGNDESFF
jgi:hypothetical protein